MKFEFEGLDQLARELESTGQDVEKNKEKALKSGGEVLQKRTKASAPYKTGNLKDHIELSDVENDEIEVYVDNQGNAYYGYMLEFGTSKMSARPFMAPAFNASTGEMQQAMAISIRDSLRSFI